MKNLGNKAHPPVFCHAEVIHRPKCVYFEGNCIGLRSETPPLLPLLWKISGRAIRGIDRCAGPCLREGWDGQRLQYYSCSRRSDVRGFNFEETK